VGEAHFVGCVLSVPKELLCKSVLGVDQQVAIQALFADLDGGQLADPAAIGSLALALDVVDVDGDPFVEDSRPLRLCRPRILTPEMTPASRLTRRVAPRLVVYSTSRSCPGGASRVAGIGQAPKK
jgi:hypothetical protein